MPGTSQFEKFFHARADLAESLFRDGWRTEGYLVGAVALDALATVADHDSPPVARREATLRLVEFVRRYGGGDPLADKIAVVFLAEDMIANGPARLHPVALRLLANRAVSGPQRQMQFREWPHAHKDCSWAALIKEEPMLSGETALEEAAEHYSYPALVYRLYRCGPAHALSQGSRTSGFAGVEPDAEISYCPPWESSNGRIRPIGLKIGLLVITGWVRTCSAAYAAQCAALGMPPADNFDASAGSLARLAKVWKKVT